MRLRDKIKGLRQRQIEEAWKRSSSTRWWSSADCAVAQQERQQASSHTCSPTETGDGRRSQSAYQRCGRDRRGPSEMREMIRSRDHPSSLSWFSMCLPTVPLSTSLLPTMSDHLAISFPLGALDLRQTPRSRMSRMGVRGRPIIAIPASCGATRRANLFFPPGTRDERDSRESCGSLRRRLHGTPTKQDSVALSCCASLYNHTCLA